MEKPPPDTAYEPRTAQARPGQSLRTHLLAVGDLAAMRSPRRLVALAIAAGRLHDVGKGRSRWQMDRLQRGEQGISHAIHGAKLALERYGDQDDAWAIALAVAGHHSSLKNLSGDDYLPGEERADGMDEVRQWAEMILTPDLPNTLRVEARSALLVRLLFAALVDGDRCDAYAFTRGQPWFEPHRAITWTPDTFPKGPKAQFRAEFREAVVARATDPGPWFRVTGPCGIGKTYALADLAARRCAAGLADGILYVGPLKVIVTQTADCFRRWFGDAAVLEHHSDFELPEGEDLRRLELAQARWDAPVIVTTAVQFFESLFSNRAGKVRKLAGLRDRVILLDEIQTLPSPFARSALRALEVLAHDYGCTIIAASATNPSFARQMPTAITPIEVVAPQDRDRWFRAMATAQWSLGGPMDWAAIAADLRAAKLSRALIVVNQTGLAAAAAIAFTEFGFPVFHLSGRMCPAHKADILARVRAGEANDEPAIVVATQVIEAGADVDFPRVYSQFSPLDALVQRAGRCDRHGRRVGSQFIIFEVSDATVQPYESGQLAATRTALAAIPTALHDPAAMLDAIAQYFDRRPMNDEIERHELAWQFEATAVTARWIEDTRETVLVSYGEIDLAAIAQAIPDRPLLRQLQRFSVPIPQSLYRPECIETLPNGLRVWRGDYGRFGLA